MLDLGKQRTIEWTTVFADHSNPYVYWYLPNHVSLDTDKNNNAIFQMIQYTGDDKQPKGAFVNLQVRLELPEGVRNKIIADIPGLFTEDWRKEGKLDAAGSLTNIKLNVAPWNGGTVECMAFDKSSVKVEAAGREVTASVTEVAARDVVFEFVRSIQGATKPSLDAKNTAIFGLHLTREAAELMLATLKGGAMLPIGIIYQLKYTGMMPSYEAHITAKMDEVYEHFSAKLSGQKKLIKVGITAGLEELKSKKVITIDIVDSNPETNKDLEAKVMEILEARIMNEWMTPVLTPGELAGMVKDPEELDAVVGRNDQLNPDANKPKDKSESPDTPDDTASSQNDPLDGDGESPDDDSDADSDDSSSEVTDTPDKPDAEPDKPEKPDSKPDKPDGKPDKPDHKPDKPDGKPDKPDDAAKPPRKPATPSNSTAGLGRIVEGLLPPKTAGQAVIAFEMKEIKQTELRTITFDLTKREAQQRSFCPQQFLSNLLPEKVELPVINVVFDEKFFDTFPIVIYGPDEESYETRALKAATVTVRYKRSKAGQPDQTKVFEFKRNKTEDKWSPHLDAPTYGYDVEYIFLDSAAWLSRGNKARHSYSYKDVEGRTINTQVRESLQFIESRIAGGDDGWDGPVKQADVEVRYPPGGAKTGAVPAKTFSVSKSKEGQDYKLRVEQTDPDHFQYRVTYKMTPTLTGPWLDSAGGGGELTISGPSIVTLTFDLECLNAASIKEMKIIISAAKTYQWKDSKTYNAKEVARLIADKQLKLQIPIPPHCEPEYRYEVLIVGKSEGDRREFRGEVEDRDRTIDLAEAE